MVSANATTNYQVSFDAEVSDEVIYTAGMEEWVTTIAQLWEAIGKGDVLNKDPEQKRRLNMYCKQLQIVPLGLLEKGIEYAIRNNTFSNVPPIGVIWEGIRKELVKCNPRGGMKDMDIADAIDQWLDSQLSRAAYRFQ